MRPAQPAYPERQITLLVGYGAGSVGTLAVAEALRASPDGHTLGLGTGGNLTVQPHRMDLAYGRPDTYAPVAKLVSYPNVLMVRGDAPSQVTVAAHRKTGCSTPVAPVFCGGAPIAPMSFVEPGGGQMSQLLSADEAIVREARIFHRKMALLNDPEFIQSNAEALAALDRGERGMTLEEFRQKHAHPRK